MNKFALIFLLFISLNKLFSQEIVFEANYTDLPFELRIDNSGVYSIASFDVDEESVYLSSFAKNGIFRFVNSYYLKNPDFSKAGSDFIIGFDTKSHFDKKANEIKNSSETILFKKNYFNGNSILSDNGGFVSGNNGEEIVIEVPNRNNLIIKSNLQDVKSKIVIDFSSNLACVDLVGIYKMGNIFVSVEKYVSEIPLKVEREVYTISKKGIVISRLLLPNIKYLYSLKDLQIDEEGNLYHLMSFVDRVLIVKWFSSTLLTKGVINYPKIYTGNIHFNDYVTSNVAAGEIPKTKSRIKSGVSRTEALKIADTYVLHQYECSSSNLSPTNITAPDGDVVKTPDWLIVGTNARIPYKWGGFNTLAQFDAGLSTGKFAGDINTDGVSSYALGVDCSGYVSRCWQLSYHASTAYMPGITTQYSSWDDLKPGDAIHKVGHVRLFVERNINGSFKIVEATSRGWGVSYWSYTTSDLQGVYTPRFYNNMESNYNSQRPELLNANFISENEVELKWSCDTTEILGYRVYNSTDGNEWNVILDENSCNTNSAKIEVQSTTNYFRISSIKNDSPDFSESNWSNVLGVSNLNAEKKAIIVDGFEREIGSWQGAGNAFVVKYGKSLEELSISFESVKNSEIENLSVQLEDYDYVFWILGDESTVDETFNSAEQLIVQNYLENEGNLFVSGSEIGWDLDYKGSSSDKAFYNNYLKAKYISDDAASVSVSGVANSIFDGLQFNIGQTYEEDYPDEISTQNGSNICLKYSNGKVGGVEFTGTFGNSVNQGSMIYLSFPLETTAKDESFNHIVSNTINYFDTPKVGVVGEEIIVSDFLLEQNYPNPFNPTTTINYTIPSIDENSGNSVYVVLTIYDILGKEVITLVNERQTAGKYDVVFDASEFKSGVFFYKLRAGNFVDVKKLIVLK